MQKISVQIGLLVAVFVVGIFSGMYYSDSAKTSVSKKSALNEYLIHSIREILSQAPGERIQFISKSDSFADVEKYQNLSTEQDSYYWFTFNSNTATELGLGVIDGGRSDFQGYYVILTADGKISDFGFHKP